MSHKDAIHYSDVAPVPATSFIRSFWYVHDTNDLWIWNPFTDQYVEYVPDVVVPPPPAATETSAGIVELATNAEALAGTATDRAVTPANLQAKVDALVEGAPVNLNTLNALAAAIADDAGFATTVANALSTKANADGTNVNTPSLSDADTSLSNSLHVQQVVEDSAATNTNVDDARSQLVVAGATNAAGNQRFVTLPGLDRYTALAERIVAGGAGGSSDSLQLTDDVVLVDGTAGILTFNIGNPASFKRKAYTICCVNADNTPVVTFNGLYPAVDGATSIPMTVGMVLTLIPTSLSSWIVKIGA